MHSGLRCTVAHFHLKRIAFGLQAFDLHGKQGAASPAAESGGGVGDGNARDALHVAVGKEREQNPVRGPVFHTATLAVARPNHYIGRFGGVQQGGQVLGIVRKVGIHLNNAVGSEGEGAMKAVAIGASQSTRAGAPYHFEMGEFRAACKEFLGTISGVIGRIVVHQQQIGVGQNMGYLRGEQRHILHFVVRRHDNHAFHQDYGFLFACCLYCTPQEVIQVR